jgi:DNA-binding transcriptional regulator YiaG
MPVASLLDLTRLIDWQSRLKEANDRLGRMEEVDRDVKAVIQELADDIRQIPQEALYRHDPYLVIALQQGALAAMRGIQESDKTRARRQLRVALEQMRHSLRDLQDEEPVVEDRTTKEIVRWLDEKLDVPQTQLALLLGTDVRTLQRWLSDETAQPQAERAMRVRAVARMANHLRHALTGPGVVQWFSRRRQELGGKSPSDLLDNAEELPRLIQLASNARSMTAS